MLQKLDRKLLRFFFVRLLRPGPPPWENYVTIWFVCTFTEVEFLSVISIGNFHPSRAKSEK